jgi:hypothetical protein
LPQKTAVPLAAQFPHTRCFSQTSNIRIKLFNGGAL